MRGMFHNCGSLEELDLSSFDTSKVTNMGWMFNISDDDPAGRGYSVLKNLNLSSFDTSKVEEFSYFLESMANVNTEITIKTNNAVFESMLSGVATRDGGQVILNYTSESENLVDQMISTKSGNSNIIKGVLVE